MSLLIIFIRSFLFCLKYLSFKQAIKVPIFVGKGVNWKKYNGEILISSSGNNIYMGMIRLGVNKGSFYIGDGKSYLIGGGKIVFFGAANICAGFRFSVSKEGELKIGHKVFMNANATISSNTIVLIGDYCSFGWNCTIIDGDGHKILNIQSRNILNSVLPVILERCCWLSSFCTITKGVTLCHHTIVPYGSVITKSNKTPFALFGGHPNNILKIDIAREDFVDK